MNLAEVLTEALPDLPPPRRTEMYPRIHPNVVVREYMELEGPMLRVVAPRGQSLFRLNRQQFELVKLFDGRRSYQEVADLFRKQSGIRMKEEQVRRFADNLEKGGFW